MAITLSQRTDLITALVGLFDAAPSSELLTGFVAGMDSGATVDSMVNNWGNSAEFAALYPTYLTNEEFAAKFVKALTGSNLDAAGVTLANDFVLAQINGGATQAEAALTAIRVLSTVDVTDAVYGAAAQQLLNKVDVATHFATTQNITDATFAQLRDVVTGVTADTQTVTDKKVLIDAGVDSLQQYLTTGQDILTGSIGSDLFVATYFDNQNTLQSGDIINGGTGVDTLAAKIGNSADYAINVETQGVEIAKFQAQAVAEDSSDNEIAGDRPGNSDLTKVDTNGSAAVDAQDMEGTSQFWSTNSRADLVIEDVRNNSHETTIVMQDTDAGDVDYAVYFDTQHITKPGATVETSLYLEILDLEAAAATGDKLTNNPYVGVKISVGGVEYSIVGDTAITTTYQDLVDALNAALTLQGLTSVKASLGQTFSKFNSDDGLKYDGTTIVLTNSGSEALTGIGWVVNGTVPSDTNVHTAIKDVDPSVSTELTQVNMIVDNVGRGSESGDFRVGNMSTGDSGSNGIQQFNLEVQRSSWITSLSTTSNDLEVVNVVNDGNHNGDLRIGDNKDNDGYTGLEDVRVFNASAMTGSVTLEADVDADVIAKYDNLKDTQNGVENDNIEFSYTTGSGADVIDFTISEEAISYEDLELAIETGAGNDLVNFKVENSNSTLNANWHTDQAALNNIVISTGAGDDTVRAFGDGEVTISTGAGNDTVYSDNSGLPTQAATWIYNAANTVIGDIQGSGAGSKFFVTDEATVTVTFSDSIDGALAVNGTSGHEVVIDLSAVSVNNVTDNAGVNQAIKSAINSDPVLNKVLKAEDGPNHSLVITSLIDGEFDNTDLAIHLNTLGYSRASTAVAQTAIVAADISATELKNYQTFVNDSSKLAGDVIGAVATGAAAAVNFATTEEVVVTLANGADATTGGSVLSFDGFSLTVADSSTAIANATAFTAAYNASANANYVAVDDLAGGITFTAKNLTSGAEFTATGDEVTVSQADPVAGNDISGVKSNEEANNNTINVGTGSDVVVLSTHDDSAETIVFTGTNQGVVDIFNFDDANDMLDFSAYLTTKVYNGGSSSVISQTTYDADGVAGGPVLGYDAAANSLSANDVTIIDMTFDINNKTLTDTFAGLNADNLKAALTAVDLDGYAGTGASTAATATTAGTVVALEANVANLVGTNLESVVMIENDDNLGEYKVFHITSTQATAAVNAVTGVELIGTVDFGASVTLTDALIAG
ncbi:hypothetical protein O1D97_06740 [Marinomonas sp. 15G1-11]|uniref:Uncharacterized protein n=1 Tax=Marinomonas phaeophyticola TaxID=3004091 RepID=A0ABT4JTK1_9GAMM|nr:hypothetical protein [Marinomonas sp. 15G1-11]MCZ2721352.1 hypothetical protein [Marinomonas sp. 15G1-11]